MPVVGVQTHPRARRAHLSKLDRFSETPKFWVSLKSTFEAAFCDASNTFLFERDCRQGGAKAGTSADENTVTFATHASGPYGNKRSMHYCWRLIAIEKLQYGGVKRVGIVPVH